MTEEKEKSPHPDVSELPPETAAAFARRMATVAKAKPKEAKA